MSRLESWLEAERAEVVAEVEVDHTIAAGLGNGDIPRPEWMGVREFATGCDVWDTAESDGMGFISLS